MKAPEAFRSISEVSEELGVAQHTLRFWETKFPFVRPVKRADGRRYYRPEDVARLTTLNRLLRVDKRSVEEVLALYRETRFETPADQPTPTLEASVRAGLEAALADLVAARERLDAALARR